MSNGPLTEDHLNRINEQLANLQVAERDAETAKRADIPVDDQLNKIREARARLQKIKQVYFPGR